LSLLAVLEPQEFTQVMHQILETATINPAFELCSDDLGGWEFAFAGTPIARQS
jgi:hypothetical protein